MQVLQAKMFSPPKLQLRDPNVFTVARFERA